MFGVSGEVLWLGRLRDGQGKGRCCDEASSDGRSSYTRVDHRGGNPHPGKRAPTEGSKPAEQAGLHDLNWLASLPGRVETLGQIVISYPKNLVVAMGFFGGGKHT